MGLNDILIKFNDTESLVFNDTESLVYDSRGIKLSEGDDVLVLSYNNNCVFYFRKIQKNDYGLYLESSPYGIACYIFKLNNFNSSLESYLKLFNLNTSSHIFSTRYNYGLNESNKNSIYDVLGSYLMNVVLFNYRNKFKSIRGFTIMDILGQDLSVGDFVIYKQESSDYNAVYKYGVLISDTKVLNEDKIIERVCFVYKLTNLNKKEYLLLEKLSLAYQSMYVTSNNKKNVRGDIYVKGKNIYLYLGRINLYLDYIGESNVVNNINLDNNKEYWLKLVTSAPPSNIDDLKEVISNTIRNTYVSDNDRYFINEYIYYKFLNLKEITSLMSIVPKGLVYHSSIPINEDIIVSIPEYAFYTSKFHIQFL